MPPLLVLLVCAACHRGVPRVDYGEAHPLPLVTPTTDNKRWYLPMDTPSGPQLWFVDTGYSRTTCDDDLVQSLGIKPRGKRRMRGEAGTLRVQRATLPPMELGGHRIPKLTCMVRDLNTTSSIDDPREIPIAGVLGIDVMRPFRAVLDPENGQILLHDPRSLDRLDVADDNVVRIRGERWLANRVTVSLGVGELNTRLVLDTGASNTYLDGTRLGLEPSWTEQGVRVRGSGPNGVIVVDRAYFDVPVLSLGAETFGPLTLTDRPNAWWEHGLLGLDVTTRFTLELDFRSRAMRLTPVEPASRPSWLVWERQEHPLNDRLSPE